MTAPIPAQGGPATTAEYDRADARDILRWLLTEHADVMISAAFRLAQGNPGMSAIIGNAARAWEAVCREAVPAAPSASETPSEDPSGHPVALRPDEAPGALTDDKETLRDRLEDLLPRDMVIWADDDELEAFPWTIGKWLDVLGHEKAHTACCKACGCATTCMAGAFYTSTVSSVLRELDRLGALREPATITEGDRDA